MRDIQQHAYWQNYADSRQEASLTDSSAVIGPLPSPGLAGLVQGAKGVYTAPIILFCFGNEPQRALVSARLRRQVCCMCVYACVPVYIRAVYHGGCMRLRLVLERCMAWPIVTAAILAMLSLGAWAPCATLP